MSRPHRKLGIAVLACCSWMLCAVAADPKLPDTTNKTLESQTEPTPVGEPTPVEEPTPADEVVSADPVVEEDRGPWEVTDRVELVFREKIAAAGEKTLSAKVLLKNISATEIPGKLVLVVDGSSVAGTKLHAPQGQFTEETPYLQMIPAKRLLDAGQETPVKTLILSSTESTQAMNLESASLRWRAFTLTKPADLEDESTADDKKVPGKDYTWGEMRKVMAIQSNATTELVEKHGGAILGTGTSEDANGNLVIRVYAAQGGMSRKIPGSIGGVPVELTVTGSIKAGPAWSAVTLKEGKAEVPAAPQPEPAAQPGTPPGEPSSMTAKVAAPLVAQLGPPTRFFARPVPIGVSIINQTDACASGTLGCRCFNRAGQQFILSNNHVIGKMNAGVAGDPICQPSLGDLPGTLRCTIIPQTVIGNLTEFHTIRYFMTAKDFAIAPINTMDASVASCILGQVDVQTPIGGYGIPARTPQENLFVGLNVQKYGRTTSYTKGRVYSVNTEAVINYGTPGFARFRYCIDIQTQFRTPAFGAPGDSGSLVVTLADRRPVGILFAGGGYDTFLNPISPVLTRFKVGVDDGLGGVPVLGSGRMGTAIGPSK